MMPNVFQIKCSTLSKFFFHHSKRRLRHHHSPLSASPLTTPGRLCTHSSSPLTTPSLVFNILPLLFAVRSHQDDAALNGKPLFIRSPSSRRIILKMRVKIEMLIMMVY
ncbi:uncharacterized protein LOC127747633 [Arachis duranensis]|uniref:Uncharacterized protein LOC127747633 n=1 Tax=Arachis duranensis TaxID=130453 RepID=A0A9C6TPE3_ARADU|nr:uncharacterized protein LOC127747633 [Arachis duranensis]